MKIQTSRWVKPFFPTTLEINGERVLIIYRQLLSSQKIEIDAKDIYNVEVDTAIFFAELIIFSRMFVDNTIKIEGLHKKDADDFQVEINRLRHELDHNILPLPKENAVSPS